MNKKVCVLLCTYNRKKCLEKVLNALSNQTHQISGIVVVDNHYFRFYRKRKNRSCGFCV